MKLAPGTIIRPDALLFDMDGTLVESTGAIDMCGHAGLSVTVRYRHESYRRYMADTVRALAPRGSDIDAEIARLLSEDARKSMKLCPWPVRANCWNACRVTDGLLSPQPTEVRRKPECISPVCQKRHYSSPVKTSRRENPRPVVTGSPPK